MRISLRTAALVISLLSSAAFCAAQNGGVVTKNLILRSAPSAQSPRIATLKPKTKVVLLSSTPTHGFYHVRSPQNQEGWVAATGLQLPSAPGKANRALVRRPVSQELEPRRPGEAAAMCQPDLSSCPPTGCAAPGSPHGIANQLKQTVPAAASGAMVTFDDFSSLQQQADSLVGEDKELTAADRAKLHSLTVSNGAVSEGDVVSILAFLVGVPHPNTGESVNCNLKGESNNDYHIPISNDAKNSDFQGIVVEMIPQNRPAAWSLANLTQTESSQRLVMITGALFYDNLHKVNGDASNPVGGQPARFSLWEIHPITQFLVCQKTDNSCDAAQAGDWAPLGGGS